MKRIGLVSDSHGHLEDLEEAVNRMGDVDLIIHTGDYIGDAEVIKNWVSIPVMAVKGNMDSFEIHKPDFIKTVIENVPFYIAHGNRENVKWGTDEFVQKVKANDCKIGIFGHTHRKDFEQVGDVFIINPGSVALPNDGSKSYAILTIDGNQINCDFYDLD